VKSNTALILNRKDLICDKNFINGEWCDAKSSLTFAVANPATGENFAITADSDSADAQKALDAAYSAFPHWREVTATERAKLLKRWHALIVKHREDLGRLMSLEQGKPLAEAIGEVDYSADYVEFYAEEAVRTFGEILPSIMPGKKQIIVKEPVGVVAAITPWNFPMAMIARKIAPALAAGCTVVAKPSEDTPLCALALVKLLDEAGAPAGLVNIVSASRDNTPQVVKVWLKDPLVRKITFTGSTSVGKYLAQESAETLKKLSLELGGNAPFVVFDDADLDAAADGLMAGKFRNSGQTCVCPNRIFVHNDIYDAFAEKMIDRVKALKVGPANIEGSQIGPMINERAIEKIDRHVQDALSKGAKLLAGGERVQNKIATGTNFYAPTILGDATEDMVIFEEETFGPVMPLIRFEDEDAVVAQANNTSYGLASYFYTADIKRVARVSGRLEAGIIGINVGAAASPWAPVGGIKDSGYGREGSHYGIEDYMHIKYICQGELD
jgi:succinate-semialdehyde dehydrogenase/glutarate-semialdehyde dehydrogenase